MQKIQIKAQKDRRIINPETGKKIEGVLTVDKNKFWSKRLIEKDVVQVVEDSKEKAKGKK